MTEDFSQPASGEAPAAEPVQIEDSPKKNVEDLLFKYLMQGGQLLDSCCPSCQNPLVKDGETPEVMSPTTLNNAAATSFDGYESELGQDDDKKPAWTPVKGVPFCVACEATVVTTEMELAYASERLALTGRSQKKGSMIVALNTAENDTTESPSLTLPASVQKEAPSAELKEHGEKQQNLCPLGIAPLMISGFKSMAEVPTPTMEAGAQPQTSPLSAMGIEHEVNSLPSCDSTNADPGQVTSEAPDRVADVPEEVKSEAKEKETVHQVGDKPDEEASVSETDDDEEPEMDYREKRALATKILGSKMLHGYTLQQSPCEECNMPLMEKNGNIDCVVCPAMAAKKEKARQQKSLERAQKRSTTSKPEPVAELEKPQKVRAESPPVVQLEEEQRADETCAIEARCEEEVRSVQSSSSQLASPEAALEPEPESNPTLLATFSEHGLAAERAERERIEMQSQEMERAQREEQAKAEFAIKAAFSEDALAAENAERERIVRERLEERMEKERLERELAQREAEEKEQAILDERRRIEKAKKEAEEREQAALDERKRTEEAWFAEQQALALELSRLEEEKHDRDIANNCKPKSEATAGPAPIKDQAAVDDPWMEEQLRLQEEVRKLEEQEQAMKVARKRLEEERNAMVEQREAAEAATPSRVRFLRQQAEKEARARARLMLALEHDAATAALATTSSPLLAKPPSLMMGSFVEQKSIQAVPASPSQQVPSTPRTALKWEKLRNKSRSEMSKRMMQGWTLSDDCCKGRECHGMFLLADMMSVKLCCSVCQGTGTGKDGQYKTGTVQSEVPRLTSPSQIQPTNANRRPSFGHVGGEMHFLTPSQKVAMQQAESEAGMMQLLAKTHPSSAAPLSPRAIVVTTSQSIQQERQDVDTRFTSVGGSTSERYGVEKRAPLPPTSSPMRPPRPMTSNRSGHMSEEHVSTLPKAMKHKSLTVSHTPQQQDDGDGDCSVFSDASSRAKSVASNTLGLIMDKIERAKSQLNVPGEQGDLASQMEVASLIEKLASAAIAVRRLEELS
jgi:uncharacterized Zn finger protein (UPF0148 family)